MGHGGHGHGAAEARPARRGVQGPLAGAPGLSLRPGDRAGGGAGEPRARARARAGSGGVDDVGGRVRSVPRALDCREPHE